MALRGYLVPVIGVGIKTDPRRPKYVQALSGDWAVIDGTSFMLLVTDITDANDLLLQANTDVLPLDVSALDTAIGAVQRTRINTGLSSRGLSTTGISPSITWRVLLRNIAGQLQPGLVDTELALYTLTI